MSPTSRLSSRLTRGTKARCVFCIMHVINVKHIVACYYSLYLVSNTDITIVELMCDLGLAPFFQNFITSHSLTYEICMFLLAKIWDCAILFF